MKIHTIQPYIIDSLLDQDFYKFSMGQVIFNKHANVPVTFSFRCRTKDTALASHVLESDLRRELDHVMTLRFDDTALHYLRGTNEYGERMFAEPYLQFLKNLQLPQYRLEYAHDAIQLEFSGPWAAVTYWETIALSVMSELFSRSVLGKMSDLEKDMVQAESVLKLAKKIKVLKENPDITFSDFGTRRRHSFDMQDYVVKTLKSELPNNQFKGTSNVYLAMKHGITPMGTNAHELQMVLAGIMGQTDESLYSSQQACFEMWWGQYGNGLSIFLSDTFGSDHAFRTISAKMAKNWKGFRQDSGDPFEFGEKTILFYKKHGIDPKQKLIVFSDGLDIETIVKLKKHFDGRINTTFGWGTNLTNDTGLPTLSLVIKATQANDIPLVKLSDNIAKATGPEDEIQRYKRVFNYTGKGYTECKY